MTMPDYVLRMIETRTGLDFSSGRGKHPKRGRCGVCRGSILRSMDDDWRVADADVYTVNETGAVWAAMSGRKVWRLYGITLGTAELWRRHEFNWNHWPAGRLFEASGLVRLVIEHRCGQPCPNRWHVRKIDSGWIGFHDCDQS